MAFIAALCFASIFTFLGYSLLVDYFVEKNKNRHIPLIEIFFPRVEQIRLLPTICILLGICFLLSAIYLFDLKGIINLRAFVIAFIFIIYPWVNYLIYMKSRVKKINKDWFFIPDPISDGEIRFSYFFALILMFSSYIFFNFGG